jgi:hypothetical protein
MARDPVVLAGLTNASTSGAATTVNVTPSFPDTTRRCHIICVHNEDTTATDNSIASVTVGGVAATLLKAQGGQSDASIYAFPFPPKGTHAVVVTPTQLATCVTRVSVYEFENIEPAPLAGQTAGNLGTATSGNSGALTSPDLATSDVVAALSVFFGTTVPAVSAATGTGMGQQATASQGTSPFRVRHSSAVGQQPGGASVTPGFTWGATAKPWAIAAVELRGENLHPQACLSGMGF